MFDGLTVTVDGLVTTGISDSTIARVHWDWGDGNSEDRWFPASHTYTAYGEYTITVTAYQSDDLTSTKAFIIDIPLVIPDANLEAAIREAINKPEGSIYTSDLEPITTLEARDRGISDLTGLEYCVNLRELVLGYNNISDISALAGLTNLQELHLYDNNISDISALAGLTNLQSLGLSNNNISDISALAGLTNLQALGLTDNNISDISPVVANSGLSDGDFVDLRGNPLSTTSVDVYIPQLEARGVAVKY